MHPAQTLSPAMATFLPTVDRTVSASVRPATADDIPALVDLINEAYEIEKYFAEGDRTDAGEVAAMATRGHFLVLDRSDGSGLAGAVYVRTDRHDDGDHGYFGMLSVASDLRSHGIGRRLVAVAEALCTALGCTWMDLQIVNLREELAPWYRRLGYHEVGTAPFHHRALKRPCHFVRMSKPLTQ